MVDEMCSNLCIRLGVKDITLGQHLVFDRLEVLNDSVVDNGNSPARQMRVCVLFGYTTVGRPTRVRNTNQSLQRILLQFFVELGDLANGATKTKRTVILDDGNTSGIVSAILKTTQPFYKNRNNVLPGNSTNNSAHSLAFLLHWFLPSWNGLLSSAFNRKLVVSDWPRYGRASTNSGTGTNLHWCDKLNT